jgi:hypothetical protein
VEILLQSRRGLDSWLRQEQNLAPDIAVPGQLLLPVQNESTLMAYDGEKANRFVANDFKRFDAAERCTVSGG